MSKGSYISKFEAKLGEALREAKNQNACEAAW